MGGALTMMINSFAFGSGGGGGATDPDFSSTKLLMGFEGSNGSTTMPDESAAARGNATVGDNAQISTAQKKFGSSSLLLDGIGDYAKFAVSADFDPAGPFTVEAFARWSGNQNSCICSNWNGGGGGGTGWWFGVDGGFLRIYALANLSFVKESTGWTPTVNQWYHLAFDRDASNDYRIYRDGVMVVKTNRTNALGTSTLDLFIGRAAHTAAAHMKGNIDEVRITKGVARYGSDSGFTVPTAAYPRS